MPVYSVSWDHHEAVAHLSAADKKLAALIERVGPDRQITVRHDHSIFESLFRAIIYQQLAGKAAAAILNRVLATFGDHGYPSPQQFIDTPEAVLRSAGLSQNKMLALKDLAAKALDGTVPSKQKVRFLSDEELVSRLTTIRGIGVWTVEMLLIFGLGRPDVLPVTDYGVRQGYALAYKKPELPAPKQLMKTGEVWRPYRSVASWYFWRAVELSRLTPPAASKDGRAK